MRKITLLLSLIICSCTYNEYYEAEQFYSYENCKEYVFTAGNEISQMWATPCGTDERVFITLQPNQSTTLCIRTDKGYNDKGLTGNASSIKYKRECN